jgi:hypothetical protein
MVKLLAGTSRRDVTPEVGVYLGGYFERKSLSTGVHDPLFSRAVYLTDGIGEVLIIGNDQLCLSNVTTPGYLDATRESIESKTGVEQDNVIIFATHTHGAPDPFETFGPNERNTRYFKRLQEDMVEVAVEAYSDTEEVKIDWATGSSKLGINRRNPKGGPIDPELIVVRMSSPGGNVRALLVSYACHGVVLGPDNLLISGDWIGHLESNLEATYAPAVTMFLPGTSGNINPRTRDLEEKLALGRDIYDRTGGTFEEMERIGSMMADEAQRTLSRATPIHEAKVRNKVANVNVKIENEMILDMVKKEEIRTKVSITQIGDLSIAGLPGEAFVEHGLHLKSISKLVTIPLSLANDYVGYLPTVEAFAEGGYEPGVSVGPTGVTAIMNAAEDLVRS